MEKENLPRKITPPMLINQISRMFDERMREVLPAGHPMTQNSCRFIMRMLHHNDGVTQNDIVKETNMKAPTISVALRNLEDEGLIRRESDPADMRSVRVYLTDHGREFDEHFRDQVHSLDDKLMQGISSEEGEELIRLLLLVRDNISAEKNKKERSKNI